MAFAWSRGVLCRLGAIGLAIALLAVLFVVVPGALSAQTATEEQAPSWHPAVAPRDVSASSTDVSAMVSWVVPAQPVGVDQDEMFLERVVDDGDGGVVVVWSGSVADEWDVREESLWSHTAGGLEAGTEYRFRVRLATMGHGDAFSEVVAVSTQSDPPAGPGGLSASVGDDGRVSLAWTVPDQPSWVGGVEFMQVERSDTGVFLRMGGVEWQSGTTGYGFVDGGPRRGLPYEYRVKMYAGGRWFYSDVAEVEVPAQVGAGPGPLAGFSLVDASDQSLLGGLADGASVLLRGASGGDFAVRADIADGAAVGSVRLELAGPASAARTESWAPYSLYGDQGHSRLRGGGPLPAGDYTLSATAYSMRYLRGDVLGTLEIDFEVVEDTRGQLDGNGVDGAAAGPLAGFRLVDADNQSLLSSLRDGATVALADPDGGSYALVADIGEGETVGSVHLELSGPLTAAGTENYAPYSLHGDNHDRDGSQLRGQSLPAGDYTLTATAYTERNLGGDTLGTLQTAFAVTDGAKPTNLQLEELHNAFLVTYQRPTAGQVDHFLIEWRTLDESYSRERSKTATGTSRTIKGLENGTDYMVRVSPVDSDGTVHAGIEQSGQPKPFRDYIEENFIEPNVDAFPWLQEAWYDEPIHIELREDDWGAYGLYYPQHKIALTFWSYRLVGIVIHELAHHYTMSNDIHLGNAEGRLAVLSGWLYLAEGGTRNTPYEAYADALNVRVTAPDRYKTGSTMDQIMHHVAQGTVPPWFYETYSSDGTLEGVDLDRLWADIRRLRCLKGGDCHYLGGSVADHARGLFGGLCSLHEARTVLWGFIVYHSPWVDGGCNNRRPQGLTATLIAGTDGGSELDVSWRAPLYATTPDIDRYVVQWKSGTQSYDTSRQAIITDLDDLPHTVTGLTTGADYTVRVAAANSADTTDFDDDDGRTRTAETTAVEGERLEVQESNAEPDPWAALRADAQTYDSFGGTFKMTRGIGYFLVSDPQIVDGELVGEARQLPQATYLTFDLEAASSVRLQIRARLDERDLSLTLEDSDGKEIATANVPDASMQVLVAALNAGTYYVRVELADGDDRCLDEDYYRANSVACRWTFAFAGKRVSEPSEDDVAAIDYDVPDIKTAAVTAPDDSGDGGFSPINSVFTLDEARLSWNAPDVDNVTEWVLQRSTNGGTWTDVRRSTEEFTEHDDRSVQPHSVYYYRLRLTVSDGTTVTSPPWVAANPKYLTVGQAYVSRLAADSVTIAWHPVADIDTIDGYRIYEEYLTLTPKLIATVGRDATDFTHTVPSSPYYYRYLVVPYSSRGTGLRWYPSTLAFVAPLSADRFVAPSFFTEAEQAPGVPLKLMYELTPLGDVELYWQAWRGAAPDGFEIRRTNWSGESRHVDVMYVAGPFTSTFVDRTFRRGSVSYEIRAVNEHGASDWKRAISPGSLVVRRDGSLR